MENTKVLVVDDHPFVTDAIELFFENVAERMTEYSFTIYKAASCEKGYELIFGKNALHYEVVILDIQMPPYVEKDIQSGQDLGQLVKAANMDSKIIVMTALTDGYRLYNVFKYLNPDGILVKGDMNQDTIIEAVLTVLQNKTFYSNSFTTLLRKQYSNTYVIDDADRKLLHYISLGHKTKELPGIMHLSLPAIEKRKRNLKKVLLVETSNDLDLINAAREKGFL